VKALSLTQPWASLVSLGQKRIETRSWPTSYRGELAIHASARFPVVDRILCLREPFASALVAGGVPETLWTDGSRGRGADWAALPLGAIVAVAQLVGCISTEEVTSQQLARQPAPYQWVIDVRRTFLEIPETECAFGDYSPGRYAWLLEDVRQLPTPVPCRGALGLWQVPPDVEAMVRQQLAEVVRA
jgi:hypothetical protein